MTIRICTQNGAAILRSEREARAIEWGRVCDEVESRLGRCTPENVLQFQEALAAAEEALPVLASELEVPWPDSPEAFAALLARTGAMAIVLEDHEEHGIVGVAHVPT